MVSGAVGKISRLCSHMFFIIQISVIFALTLPYLVPLTWCPGQLPQSPTALSATEPARHACPADYMFSLRYFFFFLK